MELTITPDKILALEAELRKLDSVEIPVTHHFSEGVYAREIFIPAGTCLTGHIHKFRNLNILAKGEMTVSTDTGMQHVQAGFIIVSPPGVKRVAYAHTDCIWVTIHGTNETDIDTIENHFIVKTYDEYLEFCEHLKLTGE